MNIPSSRDASVFARFLPTFTPGADMQRSPLRQAISAATRTPEPMALERVLAQARLAPDMAQRSHALAQHIAQTLRSRESTGGRSGLVQSLLQEFALSSQEGVALMCLAEALLRIPDAPTRDTLIRDKISQGQWRTHLGKSTSLFVNAATWGLLITGKLVATHNESGLSAAMGRVVSVGGEPIIRKGVDMAMRLMGQQFVAGETIAQALANGAGREAEGFRFSFDMLGEAAMTAHDAARYLRDYEQAIQAIGAASGGRGVYEGPGISIKLSALHPRYSQAQADRVATELYPVLVRLCALAKRHDIGLNIDAEETERLDLSLDLLERLALEPQLQGWMGLGFVVQAYQKRCPQVITWLVDLARRSQRRLMVRLVKGAYWDAEIKRAQVDGQDDYPVYTRKAYTDVSYIACARQLLAAPEHIYPQFATHNAHTLAAVYELADPQHYTPAQYEFQCLHGMGEPIYEQVVGSTGQGKLGRPCRIYAPVGTHETLLAYLVRRLLENGANSSFVNRMADPQVSLHDLVRDPVDVIDVWARTEGAVGLPHPGIVLPHDLYGPTRSNASGLDLNNPAALQALARELRNGARRDHDAAPMLGVNAKVEAKVGSAVGTSAHLRDMDNTSVPALNPSLHSDVVGHVREASLADVDAALTCAHEAAPTWADTPVAHRAKCLQDTANRIEADMPQWMALLMREAGKTASNALAEVREAVDFLRYYANQISTHFDNTTHLPLGPVVCISPWNFPLAIFMGQVSAALAAGNVVLAKPAEQTPLVAAAAVQALWDAGVPCAAVQLLPGRGEVVGARLVQDVRVQGVLFTGSTEVARLLQAQLVGRFDARGRAIPLVAETGGQNAMVVDSSALPEQVVADVLSSAFDSAGQRCSALRVLCLQEDIADHTLHMLLGAMAELRVGRTDQLHTDIGPVIDASAKASIERHIAAMRARGCRVHQLSRPSDTPLQHGCYVLPTVIEINALSALQAEVFGPVLHVLRYRSDGLDELLAQINATGYGLTMGVHTRIDETIARVTQQSHAGNLYVNRNMVGAVVGVQPFGGEGLSGTGPKAGGPLYLYRLLQKRPHDALHRAMGGDAHQPLRRSLELPGPTGERNTYRIEPRSCILGLAETGTDSDSEADYLAQLAVAETLGARLIWPLSAKPMYERLPEARRAQVSLVTHWTSTHIPFDLVLLHGSTHALTQVQAQLAQRPGPVINVERLDPGDAAIPLERLVVERAVSVNTAAAGGNASLMTMD